MPNDSSEQGQFSETAGITEADFIAARNVAYGCLSATEELAFASRDISTHVNKTNVFTCDDFTIVPQDKTHSRTTRAVEYLGKVLDYAGIEYERNAFERGRFNWKGSNGQDKIGKVKGWLLRVCDGGKWKACNTAHEKALHWARDLWYAIESCLQEEVIEEEDSYERRNDFCLDLALVEKHVERIHECIARRNAHQCDYAVAKEDVEKEFTRALAAWQEDGGPVLAEPQSPKRKGYTADEFNVKAREYLETHATPERKVTTRELAEYLKTQNPAGTCSLATVHKLPFWQAYQDKLTQQGRKGKKNKPKAVAFSSKMEAVVGEGVENEVVQQLIRQQEADYEPSPLVDDPPDARHPVYCPKGV